MAEYLGLPTFEETGNNFDDYVIYPGRLEEDRHRATQMDRSELSASSIDSKISLGSLMGQSYAESPLSSLGSPQCEGDFMRQISSVEHPQISFQSPDVQTVFGEPSTVLPWEPNTKLPLFNIEKDGDPNINWDMYYDFTVTKTDAYFQLQPGYLPTDKYPPLVESKPISENGKKRFPCWFPKCTARPFTRHYDLDRHFSTLHQGGKVQCSKESGGREPGEKEQSEKARMNCDYRKCAHTEPLRKDHCREHYREYHNEDLIKKCQPKQDKSKQGKSKQSKKPQETVEQFLAARIQNLPLYWWRCSKCLRRVNVSSNDYTCPKCNLPCENERVICREDARNLSNNKINFTSAQKDSVVCGHCENTWLRDEIDENLWVPCPRCQPDARVTTGNC